MAGAGPAYLIVADGDFGPMTSKTANSVIRYRPERVVAVLDRRHAGHTVQDVLGFGGDIPVVGSVGEGLARGADAVLIGIAPQGGKLPDEWREWLAEALEHGCDLWNGLHTFLADDPVLAAKAAARGRRIPGESLRSLASSAGLRARPARLRRCGSLRGESRRSTRTVSAAPPSRSPRAAPGRR